MATVDEPGLRAYLGLTQAEMGTEALTAVLASEQAAQAAVCAVPADGLTDDLAEALRRRVARNLAMRAVPLAVQVGELGPVQLASIDPEIRRLEAPYLKSERPAVG